MPSFGGQFYRTEGFNPKQILLQMVALQVLWYAVFGFIVASADYAYGIEPTSKQIFIQANYNLSSQIGVATVCGQWVSSVLFAPILSMVVVRVKKVLDFTLTIYFWHFLVCLHYELPGIGWWGTSSIAVLVGTLISEAICVRWELKTIELGGSKNRYEPVSATPVGNERATPNADTLEFEMPDPTSNP